MDPNIAPQASSATAQPHTKPLPQLPHEVQLMITRAALDNAYPVMFAGPHCPRPFRTACRHRVSWARYHAGNGDNRQDATDQMSCARWRRYIGHNNHGSSKTTFGELINFPQFGVYYYTALNHVLQSRGHAAEVMRVLSVHANDALEAEENAEEKVDKMRIEMALSTASLGTTQAIANAMETM